MYIHVYRCVCTDTHYIPFRVAYAHVLDVIKADCYARVRNNLAIHRRSIRPTGMAGIKRMFMSLDEILQVLSELGSED